MYWAIYTATSQPLSMCWFHNLPDFKRVEFSSEVNDTVKTYPGNSESFASFNFKLVCTAVTLAFVGGCSYSLSACEIYWGTGPVMSSIFNDEKAQNWSPRPDQMVILAWMKHHMQVKQIQPCQSNLMVCKVIWLYPPSGVNLSCSERCMCWAPSP